MSCRSLIEDTKSIIDISRNIIDDSRSIFDNSSNVIDDYRNIINFHKRYSKLWYHSLMTRGVIYDHNIFIIKGIGQIS
jgi:hypothetical protein